MMNKRLEMVILFASWAGFAWIVLRRAQSGAISENAFFGAGYFVGMIGFTLFSVLAAVIVANRFFNPPRYMNFLIAGVVIIAIAALDVFGLRQLFG